MRAPPPPRCPRRAPRRSGIAPARPSPRPSPCSARLRPPRAVRRGRRPSPSSQPPIPHASTPSAPTPIPSRASPAPPSPPETAGCAARGRARSPPPPDRPSPPAAPPRAPRRARPGGFPELGLAARRRRLAVARSLQLSEGRLEPRGELAVGAAVAVVPADAGRRGHGGGGRGGGDGGGRRRPQRRRRVVPPRRRSCGTRRDGCDCHGCGDAMEEGVVSPAAPRWVPPTGRGVDTDGEPPAPPAGSISATAFWKAPCRIVSRSSSSFASGELEPASASPSASGRRRASRRARRAPATARAAATRPRPP